MVLWPLVAAFFAGCFYDSMRLWLVRFLFHFVLLRYGLPAVLIILLGIVAPVGVLWEFGEFVVDRFILNTGFMCLEGIFEDTLADLLFDILGGAAGFFFYKRFLKTFHV